MRSSQAASPAPKKSALKGSPDSASFIQKPNSATKDIYIKKESSPHQSKNPLQHIPNLSRHFKQQSWLHFTKKLNFKNTQKNLKKSYENLQRIIESLQNKQEEIDQLQNNKSINQIARPSHQNDVARPPRPRRKPSQQPQNVQNNSKNIIKSSPVVSPRRARSVQRSPAVKESVKTQKDSSISPTKNQIDTARLIKRLRHLWVMFSQNLRRSRQRMKLFHNQRYVEYIKKWKSMIYKAAHKQEMTSLYRLKVYVIKSAVYIINQIFEKNKIPLVSDSLIDKNVSQLKDACIPTVLSSIICQLNYRRSKAIPISIPRLTYKEPEIISNQKLFDMVQNIISSSICQIRQNDIDDETAEDLIPVKNFVGVTKIFGETNLSNLRRLQRKDIRLIINDRIVTNIVQSVYNIIEFPIRPNSVNTDDLNEILKVLKIDDVIPRISKSNINSINNMKQKDVKLYVNKRSIDNVIDSIICETVVPIEYNTISDETGREIIEKEVYEDIDQFSVFDITKLFQFEPIDIRFYVSNKFTDNKIAELIVDTYIPIIQNIPNDETCQEIVENDDFDDINEYSILNIEPLRNYEGSDIRLLVNDIIVDEIVQILLENNDLPLQPNGFSNNDILKIAEKQIVEDSLITLPVGFPKHLNTYQPIDVQFHVNGRIAEEIVGEIYDQFNLPIISNKVTDEDVKEIIDDDYNDVPELFSFLDISNLLNIDPFERRITIDRKIYLKEKKSLINEILNGIPIIPNIVSDETADEIALIEDLHDCVKVIPTPNVSSLLNITPKDMNFYINNRGIEDFVDSLVEDIQIPLVDNAPNDAEIATIADLTVEEVFNDLQFASTSPANRYQPKDIQLYVNARIVDDVVSSIFNSFDLPFATNIATHEDIDEILETEDFGDVVPEFGQVDIMFLEILNPGERKIDFNFPINSTDIFNEVTFPIEPNDINDFDLDTICTVVDPTADFQTYNFDFNGHRPLKEYVAPKEVFEYLDDIVDRLMERILRTEILTHMPLEKCVFIENDTACEILGADFIDIKSIFNPMAKPFVEHLENVEIPERPFVLTPDDILENLLWNDVFPKMPIIMKRKRLIDFRDVVDDIILDNYTNSKSTHNSSVENPSESSYDENLPYLMTSPSNPSSPSPRHIPSLLDTSDSSSDNFNSPTRVENKLSESDISANFDVNQNSDNVNKQENFATLEEEEEDFISEISSDESTDDFAIEKHYKITASPLS